MVRLEECGLDTGPCLLQRREPTSVTPASSLSLSHTHSLHTPPAGLFLFLRLTLFSLTTGPLHVLFWRCLKHSSTLSCPLSCGQVLFFCSWLKHPFLQVAFSEGHSHLSTRTSPPLAHQSSSLSCKCVTIYL